MSGATTTISLRVPTNAKLDVQRYAREEHKSLSAFIMNAVYEYIEEQEDIRAYDEALVEFEKDPTTYTLDEVMRECGLR